MREIILNFQYTIKHLDGVGYIFKRGDAWKEVTDYDKAVIHKIETIEEENVKLKAELRNLKGS